MGTAHRLVPVSRFLTQLASLSISLHMQLGIIAGGLADGSVCLWDPAAILSGQGQPLLARMQKHVGAVSLSSFALASMSAWHKSSASASGRSFSPLLLARLGGQNVVCRSKASSSTRSAPTCWPLELQTATCASGTSPSPPRPPCTQPSRCVRVKGELMKQAQEASPLSVKT